MLNAAGIPETVCVDEGSGKMPPQVRIDVLAAALPHDPDSPGRGNGAKKEGDFCRKGCSHSPCLSLSGLAGVSASSAALLPAGLMSRGGGGSGEPAARTAFPPASRPPRDSLRGDSSEQIVGEGLR